MLPAQQQQPHRVAPQRRRPRHPRRPDHPAPRTVRAAQRVRELAAPWHEARHWPGLQVVNRRALNERVGRRLSHLELNVFSLLRRASLTHPGLEVSIPELAAKLDRCERQIYRALDGLGDCHAACSGPCRTPGNDRRGRPKCRGCARPCAPGCTAHVRLVRRVHQFVVLNWETPDGRRWRRRKCASVLLLGTAARRARAVSKPIESADENVRSKPLSPSEGGREREEKSQNAGCAGGEGAGFAGASGPYGASGVDPAIAAPAPTPLAATEEADERGRAGAGEQQLASQPQRPVATSRDIPPTAGTAVPIVRWEGDVTAPVTELPPALRAYAGPTAASRDAEARAAKARAWAELRARAAARDARDSRDPDASRGADAHVTGGAA